MTLIWWGSRRSLFGAWWKSQLKASATLVVPFWKISVIIFGHRYFTFINITQIILLTAVPFKTSKWNNQVQNNLYNYGSGMRSYLGAGNSCNAYHISLFIMFLAHPKVFIYVFPCVYVLLSSFIMSYDTPTSL